MKFYTRIIEYNNDSLCKKCFKQIDGLLYNVAINQNIRLICENQHIECKVVNINDSVYDDIIYRYIEVIIIN